MDPGRSPRRGGRPGAALCARGDPPYNPPPTRGAPLRARGAGGAPEGAESMRHGSTPAAAFALAALLAAPAPTRADDEAALPDSALGMRVAPLLLTTRADVVADLKLSPEQAAS